MRIVAVALVLCVLMCSCSRDTGSGNNANTAEKAASSAQNLNTLTVIDKPKEGATVHQTMDVSGWALIPEGTRSVTVTVDKNLTFPAQINLPRADVAAAHPQYNNSNAGWSAQVPLASISPGPHVVSVAAVSNTGRSVGISTFNVNVK